MQISWDFLSLYEEANLVNRGVANYNNPVICWKLYDVNIISFPRLLQFSPSPKYFSGSII